MTRDELSPVEVFAGTEFEAAMIKNLLENEHIEAWIWNEILGSRQAIPIHNFVTIVVHQRNYNKAKDIVDEYFRNISKID